MRTIRTHRLVCCTLALGLALHAATALAGPEAPPSAPAEPAKEPKADGAEQSDGAKRAGELKSQGDDAMQRIDYEKALALYDEAYALDPNPALLYNRGRAYEALARYPEALEQLEAFVRDAPAELKSRVPKLEELVARVKGKVSELGVRCNVKGARVLVRQKLVGTTPLDKPLRLNAGSAVVEVTREGYHPFKKTLSLTGGSRVELEASLFSKATNGVLVVSSPVAGSLVFVDGRRLGSVPAQTVLPAGKHGIRVTHEGYDTADTTAVVVAGGRNEVSVPLDRPPPITQKWWFWTGVGVVVVGGAVLTYALLTERDADKGDIPPGQVSGPLLSF